MTIILKLGTKVAGQTKEILWNHFYSQAQRDTSELKSNANGSQMPPWAALTFSSDSGLYPAPYLNASLEYLCCRCLAAKSRPTLCDPMNCSLPGSSIHGILQVCIGEGNGTPLQYSCLEKSHGWRSLVGCSPWGR